TARRRRPRPRPVYLDLAAAPRAGAGQAGPTGRAAGGGPVGGLQHGVLSRRSLRGPWARPALGQLVRFAARRRRSADGRWTGGAHWGSSGRGQGPAQSLVRLARRDSVNGRAPDYNLAPMRAPSLLFTQCLQNDFVKPVGRYDVVPNRLHVGFAEALRLMGEIP